MVHNTMATIGALTLIITFITPMVTDLVTMVTVTTVTLEDPYLLIQIIGQGQTGKPKISAPAHIREIMVV